MAEQFYPKIVFHNLFTGKTVNITLDDGSITSIVPNQPLTLNFNYSIDKDVDNDGYITYVDKTEVLEKLAGVVGWSIIIAKPTINQELDNSNLCTGVLNFSTATTAVEGFTINHTETEITISTFPDLNDSTSLDKNTVVTLRQGNIYRYEIPSFNNSKTQYVCIKYKGTVDTKGSFEIKSDIVKLKTT